MKVAGLLLVLFAGAAFAQGLPGARVALVIGNGAYASVQKLSNPANDAADMAAKLESLGFGVTKLVDANLADMRKAQHDFAESAKGSGMRVFYYAGHGVQSAEGQNWLLPVDASIKEDYELSTQALSAQLVLDSLKAAGTGVNIVILDACRDNPFKGSSRSAGASRGLAVMGTSGSLIVYATGPGSIAADGKGRNGVFTEALLARLDSPGVSLQEIMTNVAADVVERTKGAQEPWKQDNLTRMVYFVTPEDARAGLAVRLTKGQGEVDSLDSQIASLRTKFGAERNAAKRAVIDLDIKKQTALQAQKKQEADALAAERDRLAQAEKSQAGMVSQLASFRAEAAAREDAIRKAADAKRKELEALKTGSGGALPYILASESARAALADIGARYDASLSTVTLAVAKSYDQKLSTLSGWSEEPWENTAEFKARVKAERSRLESEKQAALSEAGSGTEANRAQALAPFAQAAKDAIAGLEADRYSYSGDSVKVAVGTFDKNDKYFPVTLSSAVPAIPFTASFRYSIKSDGSEELKRRYLEFDGWQKAGSLFGEIETSIAAVGSAGFVNQVEAVRVKAVDVAGEKLLYEDRPQKPVSLFVGSADRDKAKAVSSYLSVIAPGAVISVNGKILGNDRAFVLVPAAGNYAIRATLPSGKVLEEKRILRAGALERVVFTMPGILVVTTSPPGARVLIDGRERGKSPLTLNDLDLGQVAIEVRSEGYNYSFQKAFVEAGKTTKVAFALKRAEIKIGDSYAGGIVFYLGGQGGGLVAAPVDQSSSLQWYNGSFKTTGATATGIGDGGANTARIISAQGAGNYAAALCANLSLGGFTDWYLPSKDELDLMYGNLKTAGRGGFGSAWYWSSSEVNYGTAWGQDFDGGRQANYTKGNNGSGVRAVRAFNN